MPIADPDATLLERLSAGDPAAARLLVRAKLPRVLGLATRVLGDRGDAEEVAQETFLRVWRQAAAWKPGAAKFDTWLHTVALNLCRDRLRRRRPIVGDELPDIADPSPDAESGMIEAERGRRVAAAVAALPERQREAIALVHYQDCSGQEAADIMEVSVDALESLLARARRTLRARLNPQETGDG